jgi:2,6-dihydroxypseudooxynicotine hydrolase
VGISLGGYYVARAAAFESRLRAAASIGGPYDFGAVFDSAPVLTQQALQARFRLGSKDEAREATRQLTLREAASRIRQPFFVVFGKQDRLIHYTQAERLSEEIASGDKRFDLHEDGNHVCNNIPWAWRPQVGDWLAERLSQT